MSKVLLISDLHLGSEATDIEMIHKIADKYWRGESLLFLGDLLDLGIDRGMEFDNKKSPQEQVDILENLCLGLYCKGYVLGGHEKRIFKKVGLNPYKHIFKIAPEHEYNIDGRKIYIAHGKSVAENTFLEHAKIARWSDADIIAMGHSHVLAKYTNLNAGKLRHFVRTGHMMSKQPIYAADASFAPLLPGWCEYNTKTNHVTLKAIYEGKVIDI